MRFNIKSAPLKILSLFLIALLIACSDSSTSADEDRNRQTFDLILADNGQTVGSVVTEDALEGDDTLSSTAFFAIVTITESGFTQPLTVRIDHPNGRCGIGNVFSEERRDLPCSYDLFLNEKQGFRVIAEDGDGDIAVLDL